MMCHQHTHPLTAQNGKVDTATLVAKPASDQSEHWAPRNQPWRTEPEITGKRQAFLTRRRKIKANKEKFIYPFKDVKLSRADIEWLLATHESGGSTGPIRWEDEKQRQREGLDLRGALLRGVNPGERINLAGLPLARLHGCLTQKEQKGAEEIECIMARIHLEGAILEKADLRGAYLHHADLRGAELSSANLQNADLSAASLEEANFEKAQLQGADLTEVKLQRGSLRRTELKGASLRKAELEKVDLYHAQIENADFAGANLEGANVEGIILSRADDNGPLLADVNWTNVTLSTVDWKQGISLGDDKMAQQIHSSKLVQQEAYEQAVRANHQLAMALRVQGLSDLTASFDYKAQKLQRKVFKYQRRYGKWAFSLLLDLISGYGHRIARILITYLLVVLFCAGAYFLLGLYQGPGISFPDAILISITAFHGRVFLDPFSHYEPQMWVTALEAIIGVLVEGIFIAMLIQRSFGR